MASFVDTVLPEARESGGVELWSSTQPGESTQLRSMDCRECWLRVTDAKVLLDKQCRVLVVRGARSGKWQLPGGMIYFGSSKLVLKVKYRADGTPDKDKARLVALGFIQQIGVDFYSTFSPMASLTSVRTIFAKSCLDIRRGRERAAPGTGR